MWGLAACSPHDLMLLQYYYTILAASALPPLLASRGLRTTLPPNARKYVCKRTNEPGDINGNAISEGMRRTTGFARPNGERGKNESL